MAVTKAPEQRFRDRVAVERLAESWSFSARDRFALTTIPLILLVGWGTQFVASGPVRAVVDTVLRCALAVVLLVAYGALLADHWRAFQRAKWRGRGLAILGAVVMQLIVSAVRAAVPTTATDDLPQVVDVEAAGHAQMALLLFLGLGPVATALIEDTVFRHTLLTRIPVWRGRLLPAALVVVNAAVFGAVHYHNFGSLLGTVPYMAAGLFFNLVYLWTRNLWHVLLIHILNNAVLAVGGVLAIWVLRSVTGAMP